MCRKLTVRIKKTNWAVSNQTPSAGVTGVVSDYQRHNYDNFGCRKMGCDCAKMTGSDPVSPGFGSQLYNSALNNMYHLVFEYNLN